MTIAFIFLALALLFFCLLVCFLDLLVFYQREEKTFFGTERGEAYGQYLQNREKKVKGKRKKNFLLHLRYQNYLACGEKEKAEQLFPFLKSDRMLGLKGK